MKRFRLILLLFFAIIVAGGCLFGNEMMTILSIRRLSDKPAYAVTRYGDYAMDEYMKAGVEDWEGVLFFLNENLAHGVGKHLYGVNNCSSFFATTPDGHYILARNLDTREVVPAVIRTGVRVGIRTLGMTNLARSGWTEERWLSKLTVISSPYYTLDGMNEYGLAVASSSVPDHHEMIDDGKVTIHDLTVNRVLLDNARNVDEAIELLGHYNVKMERTYPSHYMIADDTGKCVVVEFVNGEMQCVEKARDYQIATNFLLYLRNEGGTSPCVRYNSYDNALHEAGGRLTIDEALDLLKENTIEGQAQWSVVYDLTAKTMTLTFADDYTKEYSFELEEG